MAQASWLEEKYTPQTLVSGQAAPPPMSERHAPVESLKAHNFDPNYWVETSSVFTFAQEAAVLLLNQDHRFIASQKIAQGHYFHPDAFSAQFVKEQQALEQVMSREEVSIRAFATDGPQLDPTFAPSPGQWQVIFPMHQTVSKKDQVVLEQDLAVRMRIKLREEHNLSSWQVVHVEIKPMEDKKHA